MATLVAAWESRSPDRSQSEEGLHDSLRIGPTPFGFAFVAMTDRGVCALTPGKTRIPPRPGSLARGSPGRRSRGGRRGHRADPASPERLARRRSRPGRHPPRPAGDAVPAPGLGGPADDPARIDPDVRRDRPSDRLAPGGAGRRRCVRPEPGGPARALPPRRAPRRRRGRILLGNRAETSPAGRGHAAPAS